MHVLGHSFSQHRRKSSSKLPRDLHIRKVSFSGCSLSSEHSLDSASSTSTVSTARIARTPNKGSFDPLNLHPTHQPPPRLYERPFIHLDHGRCDAAPAIFLDDDIEVVDECEEDFQEREMRREPPKEMMTLPPHVGPMDHSSDDAQEPQDYFFTTLAKRPPMPRSRWSESTIHTIQSIEQMTSGGEDDDFEEDDDDADDLGLSRRPSSVFQANYKRNTLPRRPPMKGMDSIEDFIKRGGWKRRGIVFQMEDMQLGDKQ